MRAHLQADPDVASPETFSLWRFYAYFLRLGTVGFGGPIALAGFMQRDLVEERRWIERQDYMDGLALAQLAPGPLAAQLAIYLGYIKAGIAGATIVSICFVAPSFFMVWAISAAYVAFGGLPWMQGLFYGIGAAVIGIIARSAHKLTRLTLGRDPTLWLIFAVMGLATAWTEREIVWLFLLAGGLTVALAAVRSRTPAAPPTVASGLAVISAGSATAAALAPTLNNVFWLFAKAGAFVFGSGLAIVPFLYGELVQTHQWLNDRQFLDAVAVAMITPGPVVITVAFIGYLVAGQVGALVAAIGVFLPVYFFVVIPYPWFDRWSGNPQLRAFVNGVTAATTGAIAGACVVLARRAIFDVPTLIIGAVALLVIWRFKVPEPFLIAGGAALGLLAFGLKG